MAKISGASISGAGSVRLVSIGNAQRRRSAASMAKSEGIEKLVAKIKRNISGIRRQQHHGEK
jgi:hypothetical protein